MARPSIEIEARIKVSKILLASETIGTGLTYHELSKRMRHVVKSPPTLQKFFEKWKQEGFLKTEQDPNDDRTFIVKGVPEALREERLIDLALQKVQELAEGSFAQTSYRDWRKHVVNLTQGKTHLTPEEVNEVFDHPYLARKDKAWKLLEIAHSTFRKANEELLQGDVYLCTCGKHPIVPKGMMDILDHSHWMLQKILAEGKKDSDKEMWLRQLGAYDH